MLFTLALALHLHAHEGGVGGVPHAEVEQLLEGGEGHLLLAKRPFRLAQRPQPDQRPVGHHGQSPRRPWLRMACSTSTWCSARDSSTSAAVTPRSRRTPSYTVQVASPSPGRLRSTDLTTA